MLDLSDKEIVSAPTPRAARDEAAAAPEVELPQVGRRYRHYKGHLYRIVGSCTIEATLEKGVLYQAIDPQARQDVWLRPVSDFCGPHSSGSDAPRFALLPEPTMDGLKRYVSPELVPPAVLERLLTRYDEPGRFFHARWHILDLFDRAAALDLELSPEQVVAILFHDAIYVAGVAEGINEKLSALLLKDTSSQLGQFDLGIACRIIEDTAQHRPTLPESHVVLDLDVAGLADDVVPFCAADELVWLENRHLLERDGARKDFDTRRLKFLLSMADRGPMFHSPAFQPLEDRARSNLEGLRQAWVRKYQKAA